MADVVRIEDRVEILDLFHQYTDALDFKDWARLEGLFTPDVKSLWFEQYQVDGREQVIGFISDLVGKVGRTHHMVSNFRVSFDGDTAEASVRVKAYHVGIGDKAGLFEESLGTFDASVARTPEGWRFTRFDEVLFVMLGTQEVFGLEEPA
ncbi:nuclear transport factor 2 family protein [Dactylosporangium sp. NPDC051485]|uniref:nuclear transport factor 2 family protein n=1 Tax=Dactylosporangium sp. NPDC051485 TaxID=3154846 RepID=UPI00344662B7